MAKTLKIITKPNPLLRKKSRDIKDLKSAALKAFIRDLKKTLDESEGIGIAAPQVGKNIRLIVVKDLDRGENAQSIALINPIIKKTSKREISAEEGCLSVPGVFGIVKRPKKVTVTALNDRGENVKIRTKGMYSILLQHEIDHLNGILFIDKAISITKQSTEGNVKF